jgi:DNA transposition AAA+ family ATPase
MLNESAASVNSGFNGGDIADRSEEQRKLKMRMARYQDMTPEKAQEKLSATMARWELLKNRLADEISRGLSIVRIANETRLKAEMISMWATDFDWFRESRRIGSESEAEIIETALETRFNELDLERENEQRRSPARIETSVTREVLAAIAMSRELVEIVDISAPPGCGKSEGVAEYVAKARKIEGFDCPVWLIQLNEFSLSSKTVLQMVGQACISANYGSFDEAAMFREIADKTQGKGGVLIVEEAQHLDDAKSGFRVFNGLRRFVDAKCFGIAMIGNGELYRRFKSGQHAQLLSRIVSFRKEIPGITEEDVDSVMAAWGVSGKAERHACLKIAKNPGALRNLTGVFRRALREYGVIDLATINAVPK